MTNHYPDELLDVLMSIRGPIDVGIKNIDIDVHQDYARIDFLLNTGEISFMIPLSDIESIAAFQYWKSSPKALWISCKALFHSFIDWYEDVYQVWIKNDTGHLISPAFKQEILNELDRIQDIFNKEN